LSGSLFDDAINGGEAETGAFSDFLCGEKRLENAAHRRNVHADARVGDAQPQKVTGARIGMRFDVGGVNRHRFDADIQGAAARHGVAGIDGQIHHDLFDHTGITQDARQSGGRLKCEHDVFPQQPSQHPGHIVDGFAQVEQLALHDVFTAEHEQLPCEVCGAFGGKKNRLHLPGNFGRQRLFGEQHAGMALDNGKHIVEVVRDAGRKLADGFHFL